MFSSSDFWNVETNFDEKKHLHLLSQLNSVHSAFQIKILAKIQFRNVVSFDLERTAAIRNFVIDFSFVVII